MGEKDYYICTQLLCILMCPIHFYSAGFTCGKDVLESITVVFMTLYKTMEIAVKKLRGKKLAWKSLLSKPNFPLRP